MVKRHAVLLAALFALALPAAGLADRAVVLVTARSCGMERLSTLDMRKAYLGIPVSHENTPIRAYRLRGDDELDRVFHQTVVGMTPRSYERRLLSRVLKYGSPRPAEFDDAFRLVQALRRRPCSIGYLWQRDAARYDDIVTLRLLWQGD